MDHMMQICEASPGPHAGRGLLTTGLEDRLRGPCSITDPPLNAFLDTSTGTWPIHLPFVQMKLRRLRYRRRNPDDDGGGCGRVSRGRIPSDRSAGPGDRKNVPPSSGKKAWLKRVIPVAAMNLCNEHCSPDLAARDVPLREWYRGRPASRRNCSRFMW